MHQELCLIGADDVPLSSAIFAYDHQTNTNEYASRAVLQTAGGVLLWADLAPNGHGVFWRENVRRGTRQAC